MAALNIQNEHETLNISKCVSEFLIYQYHIVN